MKILKMLKCKPKSLQGSIRVSLGSFDLTFGDVILGMVWQLVGIEWKYAPTPLMIVQYPGEPTTGYLLNLTTGRAVRNYFISADSNGKFPPDHVDEMLMGDESEWELLDYISFDATPLCVLEETT